MGSGWHGHWLCPPPKIESIHSAFVCKKLNIIQEGIPRIQSDRTRNLKKIAPLLLTPLSEWQAGTCMGAKGPVAQMASQLSSELDIAQCQRLSVINFAIHMLYGASAILLARDTEVSPKKKAIGSGP